MRSPILTSHVVVCSGCLLASPKGELLAGTVHGVLQLWDIEGQAENSDTTPIVTLKTSMDTNSGMITSASFNKNMDLVRNY